LNDRTNFLPAIAAFGGYIHSELIRRMPYLPANYTKNSFIARPCGSGASLQLNDKIIGDFKYWNWRWRPAHHKAMGTGGAVPITLSRDGLYRLVHESTLEYTRVWRATVLSRVWIMGNGKRYGIRNPAVLIQKL